MIHASPRPTSAFSQLFRWCVLGGWGALAMVAALLVAEGITASGVRSFDPLAVTFLVMICAVLALAVRWRRGAGNAPPALSYAILLLPSLCLLLVGIAVLTSALPPLSVAFVWLVIAGEEGFLLWRERTQLRRYAQRFRRPATGRDSSAPPRETTIESRNASPETEELPPEAIQSLLRTRGAGGEEAVSGAIRADFQAGERTVYVHVGFCPPLAKVPQIEFEQTDGPEATIKLTQTLPHGARFDVRLARPITEPVRVELAFHASCNAPTPSAPGGHGSRNHQGDNDG